MTELKIGSLFSGYGGLDMGVQQVLGGEVAWHVEFDAAPSKILAHHWPTIPNYGDVTAVDWASAEPVDILTGGFPCQDVSLAGLRRGLKDGTRSGLWSEFAKAIDALRPQLVVIENVRGLLSAEATRDLESDAWGMGDGSARPTLRALGAVLGDLADLGYDAEWCGVRAADAGAPHGRFRVFILAYPAADSAHVLGDRARGTWDGRAEPADGGRTATDSYGRGFGGQKNPGGVGRLDPADAGETRERERSRAVAVDRGATAFNWGAYRPAVERWEQVIGRPAPSPTLADGKNDAARLSAIFVEWMMGLTAGHVTDPAIGLTRNEQLKALGNGVVPQQAALAIRSLLAAGVPVPRELVNV